MNHHVAAVFFAVYVVLFVVVDGCGAVDKPLVVEVGNHHLIQIDGRTVETGDI